MHLQVVGLVAIAAAATASVAAQTQAKTMPICNAWQGSEYEAAKASYPDLKDQIEVVQQQGSVPWYTDNMDANARDQIVSTLSTKCEANTKVPLVVYGIPNKDCEAGYSNAGSNKNFDDYKAFIGKLVDTFPTQNMVYIIEPDAIGLTANGGCGIEKEYPKYVKYVLEALSANPNAELYLDVGFWTLMPGGKPEALAKVVNDIWPANGAVKGIALNTANYQKTDDMILLCDSFAKLTGKNDMKCIIDTSRNNKGPSANGEWCNVKNTGIGAPPTMDTGNPRAAYFLWVKPPGESDGTCDAQKSGDAMVGPAAGKFFKESFEMLWNNGVFAEKGIKKPSRPPSPTSAPEGPGTVAPPNDEAPAPTTTTPDADQYTSSPTMAPSTSSPTPTKPKKKCNIKRRARK